MSRSRSRRQRKAPLPRKRRSWFSRLSPEVRVIALVVVVAAGIGAFVFWPRKEARPTPKLIIVAPADDAFRLALIDAGRSFARTHRDLEVVVVDARDEKMRAYEAMWRKGESRVDLLIGAEAYLAGWAQAGLLEPWDDLVASRKMRLAPAGLEAGRIAGKQVMLPVALELTCLTVAGPDSGAHPDSLERLASAARKLSSPGAPALGADWQGPWAAAVVLSTARAARPQPTQALLMGGAGEALAWWRRGIAEGWARKPATSDGSLPLLWWAGQRGAPAGDGDRGTLWLPPGAVEHGTLCAAYGAVLPRKSSHQPAARLFASEVLLSDEFQSALAQRAGLLPAVVGAWDRLSGPRWKALSGAAARSLPLSPELRARGTAERFAQLTRSCLEGETTPAAAAARLAGLL